MAKKNSKSLLGVCGAAVLFLVVLWLVPHIPEPVYRFMQDSTGFLVVKLAALLGLPASYDPSNHHFSVAGFSMQLVEECVALHYHAILTLAILLTPGQKWRRKGVALLCCNATLVFFNVLRLIFLGVVGTAYPIWFDLVHDYLWQVVFALLTVFLCVAWLESPARQARSRYRVLCYSLVFSGLFVLAFNLVKISYLRGVVWLADKVVLLSNFNQAWSARWWLAKQNNFVMVRLKGEKVLYALPDQEYSVDLWPDMLGLVLFWGFFAGGLYWLWRRRSTFALVQIGLGLSVGTLLLVLVHVGTVVALGWLLLSDPQMELGENFLWMVRGLSVLLPISCWWLVWQRIRGRIRTDGFFVENI